VVIEQRMPVLGGEAVILFVRHEQKDKSKTPDLKGNTQIKLPHNIISNALKLERNFVIRISF